MPDIGVYNDESSGDEEEEDENEIKDSGSDCDDLDEEGEDDE